MTLKWSWDAYGSTGEHKKKKKKKKKKKLWNTLKHMKRYIYAQETTGKR